jgi:hypothetical protein
MDQASRKAHWEPSVHTQSVSDLEMGRKGSDVEGGDGKDYGSTTGLNPYPFTEA